MKLSAYTLKNITSGKVAVADDDVFDLPEKVLQFGSVLLLNSFNMTTGGVGVDFAGVAESSGYNMILKQLGSALNTMSNEFFSLENSMHISN